MTGEAGSAGKAKGRVGTRDGAGDCESDDLGGEETGVGEDGGEGGSSGHIARYCTNLALCGWRVIASRNA